MDLLVFVDKHPVFTIVLIIVIVTGIVDIIKAISGDRDED